MNKWDAQFSDGRSVSHHQQMAQLSDGERTRLDALIAALDGCEDNHHQLAFEERRRRALSRGEPRGAKFNQPRTTRRY